ncbi:MAG: O-methyltransferase [Thermoanaerobaculia bacterium]
MAKRPSPPANPILRPAQARYLERLAPPRDALLLEIEALAARDGVPIAVPELGRLLEVAAAAAGEGPILEVGTAIGYGTLRLARGAPRARIVTLEQDSARIATAREFLTRAGVLERVEIVEGEALASLARITGPFRLAYLDAGKLEYRRTLDLVIPMLTVGGQILVDNLLWKGRVADPKLRDPAGDENLEAIERFNPYFTIHPQLATVLLPIGDGVGMATKKKITIREQGGPF